MLLEAAPVPMLTKRERRRLERPARKPQLGYDPRPYARRFPPAYVASRRFQRMRQRQRGKWQLLTRQTQQLPERLQSAPYGLNHARQRAFEAMRRAEGHRAGFHESAYCRRSLRELVNQMRAERLALAELLRQGLAPGPDFSFFSLPASPTFPL